MVLSVLLPKIVSLTVQVLVEFMILCRFPVFIHQCSENYNTQHVTHQEIN